MTHPKPVSPTLQKAFDALGEDFAERFMSDLLSGQATTAQLGTRLAGQGFTISPRALRDERAKHANGSPAPKPVRVSGDVRREVSISKNTAEIQVPAEEVRDTNNGTALEFLEKENLNPDEWEVTHFRRIEYGQGMTSVRFSYKRVAQLVGPDAISQDTIEGWRQDLKARTFLKASPAGRGAYVILIADPQFGKKGTAEAVENYKRGVLKHLAAASAMAPSSIHLAWMGDETENVVNSYCVGADELVLTRDLRWVPAGSLLAGDELYTIDEEKPDAQGRSFAPGSVLHNEVRELPSLKVSLSDGRTLVCTPEHPLLARRVHKHSPSTWRWVRAEDLMKPGYHGNSVTWEIMSVGQPWEAEQSWDAGWMAGFLDGEGCLSAGKDRVSGQLSFAQKPGPVLDRAISILKERGFEVNVTVGDSGVAHGVINGGHLERLRALGTFQPERLVRKVQFPRAYASTGETIHPTVTAVEDAGVQRIAVMGTSSKTYFSNGLASHNTNQPHTIELNRSQQLELDFDLRVWATKQAMEVGLPISASSVISNHGEWTRNGGKDPVTTRNDNASTYVAHQVRKLFEELEPYTGQRIDWTIGTEAPGVVVNLGGVDCYFSHGYVEKGRGSSTEVRTKNAIERQILGRRELSDVSVWFMAHYHHFYTNEFEGRTLFGCPAIEAEKSSEYMLEQFGVWSPAGVLGMLVSDETSRGWSNVNVF